MENDQEKMRLGGRSEAATVIQHNIYENGKEGVDLRCI